MITPTTSTNRYASNKGKQLTLIFSALEATSPWPCPNKVKDSENHKEKLKSCLKPVSYWVDKYHKMNMNMCSAKAHLVRTSST